MKSGVLATATLISMLLVNSVPAKAQRFFSLEVDNLSRAYLLVNAASDNTEGRPLIIMMHGSHTLPTDLAKMNWARLSHSPVMVFPVALRGQWTCSNGDVDSLRMDTNFILKILFHVQNNFKTDPSRVFIVGMGDAFCLADYFSKKHPAIVRACVRWDHTEYQSNRQGLLAPTQPIDSVVELNPSKKKNTMPGEVLPFEDTQEEFKPYNRHTTLNIHVGRWQQSGGSRTEFDSLTMTDLSDYHFVFGTQVAYHFTSRWSAHLETDFMIIPKERQINGISWGGGQGVQVKASGKGGIVIPYGLGVRYSFPYRDIRPFLSGSIGGTFLFIGGGTASGGVGGVNKSINKRKENVLRYSLGTGFEWRVAKATAVQLTGHYTLSKKIEPSLASVNRFEGISILLGLVFILRKKV